MKHIKLFEEFSEEIYNDLLDLYNKGLFLPHRYIINAIY